MKQLIDFIILAGDYEVFFLQFIYHSQNTASTEWHS